MPTNDGLAEGVSLQDILEATYNDMSTEFQSRVPADFANGNLEDFGKALFDYKPGINEFFYSLINHIGLVNVNYRSFQSPLRMFKKGWMEFGDTIEDIYIEPIKGMLYEPEVPNTNPGDQWKTFKPDMDVVYYKINRELVYPLTLNERLARRAFKSYRELDKFLSGLMNQLSNADEIDDFSLVMQLLSNYADVDGTNYYYQVPVNEVTDEETAKQLVIAVRSIVPSLRFPSRKFNQRGVLAWVDPKDLYLLVTPQTNAVLDVEVLAKAFNMSKAEFMGNIVEVPELPDGAQAILIDKEFVQDYDTLREMTTTGRNALHLTQNYFYHHHGVLATSPFYTAIMFTTNAVSAVSAVAITGSETFNLGDTKQYTATVTGGNTSAVEWSVVGEPQYVSINQNGNLTVDKKFSGNTITIKAVSVLDPAVYDTLEISKNV